MTAAKSSKFHVTNKKAKKAEKRAHARKAEKGTPEEFEVALCKGKLMALEFVSMWLKEHAEIAKLSTDDTDKVVLRRIITHMELFAKYIDERIEKGPNFISEGAKIKK